MKILVTGATGFIGSHLTRRLIYEGHDVGIIQRSESNIKRIEDVYSQLDVSFTDLSDTVMVEFAVRKFKPDIIFHLAAYYVVEHRISDIPILYNTNVLGLINLLDAALNNGVKLFVNASTSFVYDGDRHSHMNIKPANLYAVTKLQSEQACDYYSKLGMPCVTFRQFPAYGEMDNVRKFIPFVIKSAIDGSMTELKTSPGHQRWDYIYIEDIVDAYMSLIPIPKEFSYSHEIFDIGTGDAPELRNIITTILSILDSKMKPIWGAILYRKNEVFYTCADTEYIERKLHWKAKTNLYDGLKKTIEWHKKYLEEK